MDFSPIYFLFVWIVLSSLSKAEMNNELRTLALNLHNQIRSTVALGNAPNNDGSNLPKAANMYKLTYSKLIERYAQDLADSCDFEHRQFNETLNNLYKTSSTRGFSDPGQAIRGAVNLWYADLETDGQNSLILDGTNYNHFTQVIWAGVKEIGCGIANCERMTSTSNKPGFFHTYVVCNYWPAGNVVLQQIYEAGNTPASNCPSGSNANKQTGLCEIEGRSDIHG
ncbi:Ancylostoma secreted protein 2 [Aphelenchoides bicaudatus]|nr:Ancylostoma secreted protein 2 [Aphelenchoides bicaudatus]